MPNNPVNVKSSSATAAVMGVNDAPAPGGNGGWFESAQGEGVRGHSKNPNHGGVVGTNSAGGDAGYFGGNVGVTGKVTVQLGVIGNSSSPDAGVLGVNDAPAPGGNGGWFESAQGEGVRGHSKNPNHGGVVGVNDAGGDGVYGTGTRGVVGESDTFQGVYGHSKANAGVVGESEEFDGVFGLSKKATAAGVSGHNTAGGMAGYFDGNVVVTGDITLANAADCAEDFDISAESSAEPGTVMVLNDESTLQECFRPYDKRVAGVISGAGNYKPGLVLDKQPSQGNRQPIALLGKVFCKVDAQFGAIEVGDLLTTSPTPGHAMKISDPINAFGAVIGKALRPLTNSRGLIPILIALQ